MSTESDKRPRAWRRYTSISLRALLLLIFVVAGGLSWIARRASVQRNAVDAIEKAGGKVWYDLAERAQPVASTTPRPFAGAMPQWTQRLFESASEWWIWLSSSIENWPPGWLVGAVGVDYFGNVTSVSFTHRANDHALAEIGNLPRLERLDLYGSDISAEGLAHLQGLHSLHTLFLVRTKIGDAGLNRVAALRNLRVLSLEGTQLSDEGIARLTALANLEDLNLSSTAVTDAGLAHLARLTNLQILELNRTAITDSGLADIAKLKGLHELALSRTHVTDGGLAHLAGMENLVALTLDRTAVGDGGLAPIGNLARLANLSLYNTKVTSAGIARLQAERAKQQTAQAPAVMAGARAGSSAIPKLDIAY